MQPRPDSKTVVNFLSATSRSIFLLFALFFFFLTFEQSSKPLLRSWLCEAPSEQHLLDGGVVSAQDVFKRTDPALVWRPSISHRQREEVMRLVITHCSAGDLQEQVAGASEIPGSVAQDSFLLCLGLRPCSLIWKRLFILFC